VTTFRFSVTSHRQLSGEQEHQAQITDVPRFTQLPGHFESCDFSLIDTVAALRFKSCPLMRKHIRSASPRDCAIIEDSCFGGSRTKRFSPSWNHDHCGGCSTRLAERPEEWDDEVYTEGWVTLWPVTSTAEEEAELVAKWRAAGQVLVPSPERSGFQLDWLCPKCFEVSGRFWVCSRSYASSVEKAGI
jgi:hypothetical protein